MTPRTLPPTAAAIAFQRALPLLNRPCRAGALAPGDYAVKYA
ncbi:MAG: hypothetical protein ACREMR_11565 [Gemmatimonadales bacterium]